MVEKKKRTSTTPRPYAYEGGISPYFKKYFKEESASTITETALEITSTTSKGGSTITFEVPTTGSAFVASVVLQLDNKEKAITVFTNDKSLEGGKFFNRGMGSKTAFKALKEWGGGPKEIGEFGDFLDKRLRTVDVENETKKTLSADKEGIRAGITKRRKESTSNSV